MDEFTTIAEGWLFYSDGRDLYRYCPPCAKREFAKHAPARHSDVMAAEERSP